MTKAKNTGADVASKGSGSCGGNHDRSGHGDHDHHTDGNASVRDPVCGMTVDPATSRHRFDYRGETYYFCSASCRTKFAADPQKYLGNIKPEAAVSEGTIYTCPMHPQIRQIGPGNCPICGMTLEPEKVSLDAGPNHELIDMTRRFFVSAALAAPLALFVMGAHLWGLPPERRVLIPSFSPMKKRIRRAVYSA